MTGFRQMVFLLLCLAAAQASAQLVLESNPPSTRWGQVRTPHFRFIYPALMESEAQRVANTFEHIYEQETTGMSAHPRRMSVVLQGLSARSNGFVTMSPPHSELYGMPTQDYNFSGTLDWYDFLAVHEYRHMVQFEQATAGFGKVVRTLLGPATFGGLIFLSTPYWFWEGDAVATETTFTRSGRGDIPNFGVVFRTNFLEGKTFNYDKQYLGSFRDFIPDHYVLGYHMVSYLRQTSGDRDIWGRIMRRTMTLPFLPLSFSRAIHRESGYYVRTLYRKMTDDLTREWKEDLDTVRLTNPLTVNIRTNKVFTDYEFPNQLRDGRIVVMKHGLDDFNQFALLRNGREEDRVVPGFLNNNGMLSASGSKIVWNEYTQDPRWLARTYSIIKIYDTATGRIRKVTSRSRYAGAAISPDGRQIAAVKTDLSYRTTLDILDASSGRLLLSFPNPENDFYSMPRWENDKELVALKTSREGRTITAFDIEDGTSTDLIPTTVENIGHPVKVGRYLIFNSAIGGVDDIYAIDLASGLRYRVTKSKYGAYNAGLSNDSTSLYYNNQTVLGLDVVSIPFDPSAWTPFSERGKEVMISPHLTEMEADRQLLNSVPNESFNVRKYHPIQGIINPVQWGPALESDLYHIDAGISSEDIMNTTVLDVGYRYDLYERTGAISAGVSYQGLYPIIDLSFSMGDRSVDEGNLILIDTSGNTLVRNLTFDWHEQAVAGTVRLPLSFTGSRYASDLSLGNTVGWIHIADFRNDFSTDRTVFGIPFFDYVGDGDLFYNQIRISASHLHKLAPRDINSRWGQVLYANYYNTLPRGDYHGGSYSLAAYAFFPGLLRHHSLYGYGAFQRTYINGRQDDYIFSNAIALPRGQSIYRFESFYTLAANYTLPLWYPDIALGPLVYIQRVRANLFFDYGYGESVAYTDIPFRYYTSSGIEVKFDVNLLRLLPRLDFGFRYSYGIHPVTSRFEFILGTLQL